MAFLNLHRETLLDVLVNVVPLVILFVLDLLFWVVTPWEFNPVVVAAAHFLTLWPLLLLALLTYVSASIIQAESEGAGHVAESEPERQVAE